MKAMLPPLVSGVQRDERCSRDFSGRYGILTAQSNLPPRVAGRARAAVLPQFLWVLREGPRKPVEPVELIGGLRQDGCRASSQPTACRLSSQIISRRS